MPMSSRELIKMFEERGWSFIRPGKGNHKIYGKGVLRVSIPNKKELAFGTEKKLLKALREGG
jgi:predicted RNA binding protein YcfA (HicA-like mRNA interferase family)